MTDTTWIRTDRELPPEGEVVETVSSGHRVERLVRNGSLWFYPDMSMYVYYAPAAWRNLGKENG